MNVKWIVHACTLPSAADRSWYFAHRVALLSASEKVAVARPRDMGGDMAETSGAFEAAHLGVGALLSHSAESDPAHEADGLNAVDRQSTAAVLQVARLVPVGFTA